MTTKRTVFVDRLEFDDAAKVTKTKDGFLAAMPRVARTGIQLYKGSEVGKADMDVVRVYRPEAEVFKRDAFASLAHRPFTDDHPSVPVNASNWKDFAIGHSDGDVVRDGEFVRVPMVLMDGNAVAKFEAGKAELSVGYSCDLKWEAGTDPASGQAYDAVQTNIRANHIALVDRARGGHKLRIGDDGGLIADIAERKDQVTSTDKKESLMSDTAKKSTITVDGISLTMDEQSSQIVQRALADAKAKAETALAQVAQLTADAKKKDDEFEEFKKKAKEEEVKKDAEIATLKKKVEDSVLDAKALNALVADRTNVIAKAKAILGDKAPAGLEDMDTSVIRKTAVDHLMGDGAKGYDDAAYKIAFDVASKDVKVGDQQQVPTSDSMPTAVADMQRAFMKPAPSQPASAAYDKMTKRLSDAWKNPGQKAAS